MGKKFARFAAVFIALAVAISVAVPVSVSFAEDEEETTYEATLQGFLEWVADDPSEIFSASQSSSATSALSWLTGSTNKASWYDTYVELGTGADTVDALLDSLTYMEAVNNIRAAENQSELGISLKAMASAALNSYYSSNIWAHSYSYSVGSENLAQRSGEYTYSSEVDSLGWPFSGWYTEEKAIFDAAVEEDSSLEAYRYSAYDVYTLNSTLYTNAGHYLNLVNASTKSFGMASASGVTVWSGSTSSADFTVSEFKTAVATFVCEVVNGGEHDYESEVTTEATCTTDGVLTYTCSVCGDTYTETIDALGHSYDFEDVAWTWADDYSSATAVVACTNDSSHTLTATATVTSEVTTAATCVATGVKTYTATATFTLSSSEEAAAAAASADTDTVTVTGTQTEEIPIDSDAHSYDDGVVTEPTCTEGGYTTYTCTLCGYSYTTDATDALGHTAGEAVTENEAAATCTEDGSYDTVTYCTVCGEELSRETVTVAATGHGYVAVVTDPTCTEQGYTTYTCSVCGDTYVSDYTDALGHSYGAVVTDPTCTEQGYTTYTCSVCGDEYVDDETDALGHTAGEAVTENEVAATCTEDGSYDTVTYCTVCGEELSRETVTVAATGHSYEAVVTEPTCTDGGYTTYTCSVCGDTYVGDETDALGHDYVVTETDATCTEPGTTTFTCSRGDDEYVVTGEALGHDWVLVEAIIEVTCEEDGLALYECSRCDETKTDAIAAFGHDYEESERVEATCTEDGYVTYVCANDVSHTYTELLAATGHSYELVDEQDATCTEDGYATYTCSVCGDTYTETLAATGHSYEAVVTDPTCTEDGYTTYICSNCGDTYVADATEATGHSWVVSDEVSFAYTTDDDGVVTFTSAVFTFTCSACGEVQTVATDEVTTSTDADGNYVGTATVTDPEGNGSYSGTATVSAAAADDESTDDESTDGTTSGTTTETLAQTGDGTGFAMASLVLMGGFALATGLASRKRRNAA